MRLDNKGKSGCVVECRSVLLQHIHANIKDYLVLSILFIMGVMLGVVLINNSNEESQKEISGYVNSFIDSIKDEKFEIDKTRLIKVSIANNLKLVGIIWIAGTTVIGMPLIFIIIAYKGLCLGYTVSAIISSLGIWKRSCIFIIIIAFTEYNNYSSYINVKR